MKRVKEAPRRPPRTAAVAIKGISDQFSYANALKRAQGKIDLKNLGIETSKIRKAANEGILIEIPGTDGVTKADDLAAKFKEVLRGEANVTRSFVKGELRIFGFDESVTVDDIYNEVASVGKCRVNEIKVDPMRSMSNGSVWVQCPLAVALRVSAQGKHRIV